MTVPIVWQTRLWSDGSSAQLSRDLVLALDRAGYPVAIHNLDPVRVAGRRGIEAASRLRLDQLASARYPNAESLVVRCAKPNPGEDLVEGMWAVTPQALGNIAYLTTAYGYLPAAASPATANAVLTQVWGCSRFVVETLAEIGFDPAKLRRVPLGFCPDLFSPGTRPADIPTGKTFRFLHVSIPYVHYKGLDVLVRAYVEEFDSEDDTCLVLRTRPYQGMEHRLRNIIDDEVRRVGHQPEILLFTDYLPLPYLAGWYAASSCYVQTSRAAGFDMPPLQAMACGKPVIASGWGGHREFCDEDTSFLFGYTLGPPTDDAVAEGLGSVRTWAEPALDELRYWMRWAAEHPVEAAAKGHAAAEKVRESHTWDHAAAAIVDAVGSGVKALRT
ncbi:MAG TPA: glycosyltransferase family 4 protein [Acidimicrobiia bacterium]|nr:glycosyltransferase family 4 protein [Acidimicrobiia bacterium]